MRRYYGVTFAAASSCWLDAFRTAIHDEALESFSVIVSKEGICCVIDSDWFASMLLEAFAVIFSFRSTNEGDHERFVRLVQRLIRSFLQAAIRNHSSLITR